MNLRVVSSPVLPSALILYCLVILVVFLTLTPSQAGGSQATGANSQHEDSDQGACWIDMFGDMDKDQLIKIIQKMDKDKNGFLNEKEMAEWIEHTHHIHEDVDTQFEVYDKNSDSLVSLDEYVAVRKEFDGSFDKIKTANFFNKEDVNNDQKLTKTQFKDFFNKIVLQETMDDFDENKDGLMSRAEYIGDGSGDWVTKETERFNKTDKNNDGKLNKEELKELIAHDDHHATEDAKQLIKIADKDPKDEKLSKEEILEQFQDV